MNLHPPLFEYGAVGACLVVSCFHWRKNRSGALLSGGNPRFAATDCAVCAAGYGRGVANECHECTEGVKAWMYSLLVMAAVFTVVFGILIAIYLVSSEP